MSRRTRIILIVAGVIVALLVAGGFWLSRGDQAQVALDQVTGTRPKLTEVREQTFPTIGVAKAIGWKAGEAPTAAKGLKVAAFASDLEHPRWIYVLPNGDVLVSESNSPPRDSKNGGGGITGFVMKTLMGRAGAMVPSPNRIILLRDADGDGKAEVKTTLIDGLNSPSGMALVGDTLYIANTDALVKVPFKVGETKITAKPVVVTKLPGGFNHWARNVIASADGKSLFVSVGSASNIGENGMDLEAKRAAIWQVNLETGKDRIYAYGLRNANGMALEPTTGDLWTVVNERDMLGSDMVPDYLTEVQLGGFYGWPYYFWHGVRDDRVPEPEDDMSGYVIRPDYALGPHVAALGLTFSTDAMLGDAYRSGAFIGEHGSWNRKPLSGYKVVFVPFDQGKPNGKPIDVLTGFLASDQGEARGRPVAVTIAKDGALLVTDDVGNKVWRVTAAK